LAARAPSGAVKRIVVESSTSYHRRFVVDWVRMSSRATDWLAQAERDFSHACESRDTARHEWACFAAQQAAEKAAKAVHLARGQEAWGHVVAQLLAQLGEEVPADLIEKAKVLDNFYVPTRYPNGHPSGAPFEHYGSIQSGQAVQFAGEIIAFAHLQMAGPRDGA
jgi:HEPN domain-containing protein